MPSSNQSTTYWLNYEAKMKITQIITKEKPNVCIRNHMYQENNHARNQIYLSSNLSQFKMEPIYFIVIHSFLFLPIHFNNNNLY